MRISDWSSDVCSSDLEVILDHGKQPRNFRRPETSNREARGSNPLCGDQLVVYLDVDDEGCIKDAAFVGKGCAISVASASMMTELVRGRTGESAERLFEDFHAMCTCTHPPPSGGEDEVRKEHGVGKRGG